MYIIAQAPAAAVLAIPSGAAYTPFVVAAGEPGAGTQCNLNLPGSNRLNGQAFTVRASGYMTCPAGTYTSAATPIGFGLFAANTASFAAASGNLVFTTVAQGVFTIASATAVQTPWEVEVECVGYGTSNTVIGAAQGQHGTSPNLTTSIVDARVAATNIPGTVNFATEPPLQFCAGIQTAATNLLNVATCTAVLTQLVLEA